METAIQIALGAAGGFIAGVIYSDKIRHAPSRMAAFYTAEVAALRTELRTLGQKFLSKV